MADHQSEDNQLQAYLSLKQGSVVGRYRIIEQLGSGGMEDVYLAEDTELKRQVALKFLSFALNSYPDCPPAGRIEPPIPELIRTARTSLLH